MICGAAKRVWVLRTVLFTIKELMKKHETIIGCEVSVTDTQNWLLRKTWKKNTEKQGTCL
jgi:hypothetical protein